MCPQIQIICFWKQFFSASFLVWKYCDQQYWTDPDAGLTQLANSKNAYARLTFSQHSSVHFLFSNILKQVLHHHKPCTNEQGIFLSPTSSVSMKQGVLQPPQSAEMCRMYVFSPPAVWTYRVYACCRQQYRLAVSIHLHPQQCGHAGYTPSTTCSMDDMVYAFPPPAIQMCSVFTSKQTAMQVCRVYSFHQCGSVGCFPTPPSAVWTCRVYSFSSSAVWM